MSHKCNNCNKIYASYKSLWLHKYKFHNNNINIIENTNDKSKENNNDKSKENNEIKKYNCKYCNNEYKHKQTRWTHEQKCESKNNSNKINDNTREELLKNELYEIKNTLTQLIN